MPKRHIDSVSVDYYLLLFDKDGHERQESDRTLLTDTLAELVRDDVTDVFIASHGWKGDIPAAIDQYDRWIATMVKQERDSARVRALVPDFKPLTIGIHWPSLPWGVEDVGAALLGEPDDDEFAGERRMDPSELVDLYAKRIAGTDAAREALTTIATAADSAEDQQVAAESIELSAEVDEAYRTLFAEAGLRSGGVTAAPGADQEGFAPTDTAREWVAAVVAQAPVGGAGHPGLLGDGFLANLKDVILAPARQLSFWAMKDRARIVGETGVHRLLANLQRNAPAARIHLMGHSFGCILVCAAVAGPISAGEMIDPLPRPVSSLFLVQGAMSLWSFAEAIPFPPTDPGYFRPVFKATRMVSGPVVTTRSIHDHAVGQLFPVGAKLGGDRLLDENDFPEYGGIGTFGVQGSTPATDHEILNADAEYGLDPGTTYNVEASRVISVGGGASGAHSDIVRDEVAHLFWQAALSGILAER